MDPPISFAFARPQPAWISRRPALPAALCLIVGIGLALESPLAPWILLGASALASVAAILLRNRNFTPSMLVAIALICCGAAIAQSQFYRYPANDISLFSSASPQLAQLELRIDNPPYLLSRGAGGRDLPPRQMVIASVRRILTSDGWVTASGNTLVQIGQPHPLLAEGQIVRVLGMLGRPAHATNPGQFDPADFYRFEQARVLTSIRIARIANIQILSDPGPGMIAWMRDSARQLLAMGFSNQRATDHALLRALLLGDSDPLARSSKEQFQKLGIAYLLTASGTHIAIVAAFVYGICRLLMCSPRTACWACLAVVILHGIIALPSWSAFRAVVLCCAIIAAKLYRRDADRLQLLSIVAIVLLVVDPMDLFNVQFQLAFICITALLLLGPPLVRWLVYRDRHDHDILLPIPQSAWWKAWTMLRAWLAISLIFWIASVPLVSLYFGQMSPWAIPAAIVFFPIVAAALFGGFAKILLTLAWPSLAGFWAGIAVGPVIIMRHALALLTHLPAIAIPVAQPSLHGIVFYYLLLASSIFPWPRKGLRRASVAVAAAAVCCFVASLTLGFPRAALPRSDEGLSITFLDIGAGQSAVVQAPGASPAMIDAGSSTISDVTRTVLGPFLSQRGERSLGDILLSHSDYDHISAVSAALPTFGIGTVYTSHYFAHFASIDPPAQSLLDELHQAQKSPHLIERGDHVELSHGVLIDVLWPPPNCDFNCNNTGLVLRLNFAGRRVLFPADIQVDAMRELLKSPAQLKADVLVAAHHGSSEVTTADFVAAVNPQFIISSNGSPLTEKQKHFERMIGGRPLYRTSNCGAITLHIGRDGTMSVETFLPGKR